MIFRMGFATKSHPYVAKILVYYAHFLICEATLNLSVPPQLRKLRVNHIRRGRQAELPKAGASAVPEAVSEIRLRRRRQVA